MAKPGCVVWVVGLYLLFAIYAWFDFANTNHDGLANLGLFLVTFPVAIVGTLLVGTDLTPDGYGYLAAHALYYVPAVLITAALFGLLVRLISNAVGSANEQP